MHRMRVLSWWACAALLGAVGCARGETDEVASCRFDSDCRAEGERCVDGVCTAVDPPPATDAGPPPTDGSDASSLRLRVEKAGDGAGTVTSDVEGIDCGDDCTEVFPLDATVTLTATPEPGSVFAGWSGACSGTETCTVPQRADVSVTAVFELDLPILSVVREGTGSGTVTSAPAGIDCGTGCSAGFAVGTMVTLSATPATGSVFAGWSGAGCSGTDPCTVRVDEAVTVTATFEPARYDLDVVVTGDGSGRVTSSPTGIDCGADCTEAYDFGAGVTLTASPETGSTFAGWSGGGCSGVGPCTVTVTEATEVTAQFDPTQHPLTVTRSGDGSGRVTSSPAGVDCGADCTETYAYGTEVTLTAAPSAGSSFDGWSGGGCTGTGPCTVTVTAATEVTARFVAGLTCALATNVDFCTNGAVPEIDLGPGLSGSQCRSNCEAELPDIGVTRGCWVLATNGRCYCRSGEIGTGGSRPGGVCQ